MLRRGIRNNNYVLLKIARFCSWIWETILACVAPTRLIVVPLTDFSQLCLMKQWLEGLKVACVNVPRPLESARYRGGYCEHSGVYGFFEQNHTDLLRKYSHRRKKVAKFWSKRVLWRYKCIRFPRGALLNAFWTTVEIGCSNAPIIYGRKIQSHRLVHRISIATPQN